MKIKTLVLLLLLSACGPELDGSEESTAEVVVTGGPVAIGMRLYASDYRAIARFGQAVAVSGDTLLVGAQHYLGSAEYAGAVYVFRRDPSGQYLFEDRLTPVTPEVGQRFGYSVAIDGDTAIIGAPYATTRGARSGRAYVFRRSGTTWSQETILQASDPAADDYFGWSVALAHGTAWVGAPFDNNGGFTDRGAVYVFGRSRPSPWAQLTKILPLGVQDDIHFGSSVALGTTNGAIGAPGLGSGVVYLYQRSGTTHVTTFAPTLPAGSRLGHAVAMSGESIVAGAPRDDEQAADAGTAFLWRPGSLGGWAMTRLRANDPSANARFGTSVALSDTWVAAGNAGTAFYVFGLKRGDTPLSARISTENPEALAIGGNDVFAGRSARHDELSSSGEVARWSFADDAWTETQRLHAVRHGPIADVAIGESFLVLGTGSGQADIYERFAAGWAHKQRLMVTGSAFGSSVAIDGDRIAVDAYFHSNPNYPQGYFSVWTLHAGVFVPDGVVPNFQVTGEPSVSRKIALGGETVAIGAYRLQGGRGRAAIYAPVETPPFPGFFYQEIAELASPMVWNLPECPQLSDTNFGYRAQIEGDTMLISEIGFGGGQPGCNVPGLIHSYQKIAGLWTFDETLTAPVPVATDEFGYGLSLDGDRFAARSDDTIYLYARSGDSWSANFSLPVAGPLSSALVLDGPRLAFLTENPRRLEFWRYDGTTATWESTIEDPLLGARIALHDGALATSGSDGAFVFEVP